MESKSWKVDLFITEMNGTVGTIIAICLALLISDIFSPLKALADFVSSFLSLTLVIIWGLGLVFMIYKGMQDSWRSKRGLCKLEIYSILAFFYLLLFFHVVNDVLPSLKGLSDKSTHLAFLVLVIVTGTLLLILFYRMIKDRHKTQEPKGAKT